MLKHKTCIFVVHKTIFVNKLQINKLQIGKRHIIEWLTLIYIYLYIYFLKYDSMIHILMVLAVQNLAGTKYISFFCRRCLD